VFGRSPTWLGADVVTHPRSEERTFFSQSLPFGDEVQVSPCVASVNAAIHLYYPVGPSPSIQAIFIGGLRSPHPEHPISVIHDPNFHTMRTSGSRGQSAFSSVCRPSPTTRALLSDVISRTPHTCHHYRALEETRITWLPRSYKLKTQLITCARKGCQRVFLKVRLINFHVSTRCSIIQYRQPFLASLARPRAPLCETISGDHMTCINSSTWARGLPRCHRGLRAKLTYMGLLRADTRAICATNTMRNHRALPDINGKHTNLACVGIVAYLNGVAPTC
jgi:hypothetical protein